jgi:outer membrane protein TolC
MMCRNARWCFVPAFLASLGILSCCFRHTASAQEQATLPVLRQPPHDAPNPKLPPPKASSGEKPLPINLPTALQLAGSGPIDIAVASERIRVAAAQLDRADVLWLPTVYLGGDYYRHDGQIQETPGNVFGTSRTSLMAGAGPSAVFAITDALFEPLAARQVLRARQADLQTAANDSLLAVAESYFTVQQARGELAGAEDAVKQAEELVRRADKLAPGLVPPVEATRARTEASRRRQARDAAREHWRTASAELNRLLRLDPATLVQPLEPPHLRVTLLEGAYKVDDLIPIALINRPELASQQALVQATLAKLREERLRPLIPSVLLRGASTPVTGTLAGGVYGGGRNDNMSNFSARSDFDLQVLWEFQNLGFGNRARVRERRAENQVSILELFRLQDRVAAEVAQAHAQVISADARAAEAEKELKDALESMEKNFEGLSQTKRLGGDVLILVIRPAEVLAAVQALAQAYTDYYSAVADANRAQFRLYRALGHPAELITQTNKSCQPKSPPPEAPKPSRPEAPKAGTPPQANSAGVVPAAATSAEAPPPKKPKKPTESQFAVDR